MKKTTIIYLFLLFFAINATVYTVSSINSETRIQSALDENQKTLQTHYNILLKTQENIAHTAYQSTIGISRVIEIVSQAKDSTKETKAILRDELHELLNKKYQILKQKNVLQYHFVFPNNESFLRMHNPSKFGDDLTDFRADFKRINETKIPLRVFAQGRSAHGFRNIFPLFNKNNEYIGAIEISFSSEYFQWYLNKISGIHSHFLVNKEIFSSKIWKEKGLIVDYTQSAENSSYVIVLGDLHTEKKCISQNTQKLVPLHEEINNKMDQGKIFSIYIKYLDDTEVISFLPINDIKDKNIAWLVSYQTSTFISSTIKNRLMIRITTLIFSILLIYFIIKLLRSKEQSIKQNEITLKLNERLELALIGNHDGLFDLNLVDNSVYYSPRWKEMLGYRDDELSNEVSTWEALVHPEDLDNVWAELQKHIDGKTEYYDGVYRIKHKDGYWIWIEARAKAINDENGKAIRMIGTHTDITKEKAIQLKYIQQAQMVEQTHDSVISTDLEGNIVTWNLGAQRLLGYTAEEAIGQHMSMLHEKKDIPEVIRSTEILMETGEYIADVSHVTKSGKIIDVSLSLSILKDEHGKSLNLVAYAQDITKRKKAEEELRQQHKYLQSIIDGVDDPIMVIREDYSVELMNETLRQRANDTYISDPKHPKCYEVSHHRSTPCDSANHPCPLRDVINTKMHITVVHEHDVMDGEKHYVELSATPLFDKDKNCIGIIESARDITAHLEAQHELQEQKNILHYQANHDSLTGLANRVLFNDRLEQAIEKAKRSETNLALLFIDLDHFKEINDSLGHAVGDEILKVVTSRLSQTIRDEDTLARLGGDEFTIIVENLAQGQDASLLAQKIINNLSQVITIQDQELYISSSIGISLYPTDGGSAANLLKYADSAMYKAKDNGRSNFQFYSAEMTELAFERVVMETALRTALHKEEFVVYYQPQVNATTNRLTGMEALVRWKHPTMGLISPAKFIPLAESTGLIVEIDQYVMKTAMTQMTKWINQGLCSGVLYMNLAVKQLQKQDFIEILKNLMKETECKAEYLGLEVTESQIMTNPQEAILILDKVSEMGIELAVDDFGTGYSSLSYLKKLPIDKLKIDQSFVRDLPNDEDDAAITKAVVALAQSLNLKIIAEGVETKEQKEFLIQNGCENIQGYYYSKPISADEFEVILRNGFS